jgi:hypothetical protein
MKRAVIFSMAALVVAACNDSSMEPVSPNAAIAPSQARFSIVGASGVTLDFSGDIDLITERVLPSLDDATAAEKLKVEFGKLSAGLDTGTKAEVAGTVTAIRALLKPGIGAVGDVGAIEVVLDNLDRALN